MLFTPAPKLHWLWHMSFRAKHLSIRRGATFIDEDFVKHMKKIGGRSVSGTKMHMVPNTAVEKKQNVDMLSYPPLASSSVRLSRAPPLPAPLIEDACGASRRRPLPSGSAYAV
eukprot:9477495-Pyramimonas_sp.AAC.1